MSAAHGVAPAAPGGVVVLASGAGTTLEALLASGIEVRAVVCDRAAGALEVARRHGVAATLLAPSSFASDKEHERALDELIERSGARLVVLAGYLRLIGPALVRKYAGRMLNLHPSLLPRHKGLDTHRRALEAGDSVHGCTVHWVGEELDAGEVVARSEVPVLAADDAAALKERVKAAERELYPQVIAALLAGRRP